MPVDPDTWNRASQILRAAVRHGMDPVEALHNDRLILDPALELKIRTDAMEFLLREITSWRPAEFLRMKFLPHHSASPADLYSCIVEFVEAHIAAAKKGTR